jgi:signal transduction histidine kinase
MNTHPQRRQLLIANTTFYLTFAAAAARALFRLWGDPGFWYTVAMLGLYLVLLLILPRVIAQKRAYLHFLNGLQTLIGMLLLLFVNKLDYFSLLFVPPCAQSILYFDRKTALYWIGGIFLLMETGLIVQFPFSEAIGYLIIYPALIFLICSLCYLAMQAEEAQNRSEALLADLQVANRKLAAYAAQVGDLAAANERNRLARELHDSVTQIIFGITLSAQSARILLERDPARTADQLDHMQTLAQNALLEMRALIQQLRPVPASRGGLPGGLRWLAEERKSADGLVVDLNIEGEQRLPEAIEDGLFRIAQEALNNIVKHAHTDHAVVSLNLNDAARVSLCVEDDGAGFDPAKANPMPGHLGLTSMSERVQALGGKLVIDSKPGKGTRLRVELDLDQEVKHAGD